MMMASLKPSWALVVLVALHLVFDVYKYHYDVHKHYDMDDLIAAKLLDPPTNRQVADLVRNGETGNAYPNDIAANRATNVGSIASAGSNNNLSPRLASTMKYQRSLVSGEATAEPTEEVTPGSLVPGPSPTVSKQGTTFTILSEAPPTVSMAPTISAAPTAPTWWPTREPTPTPWEAWMDSGVRTNFDFGKPFNFSHIFFIGGVCNGVAWDNWYSQWVKAGEGTIPGVEVICAEASEEDQNYVYTREFHLDSLNTVVERAGDKLNETLVITVAVGLESDWTPVAHMLKQGMAFFHCKEDPNNFDLTEYGLDPRETLYFYFRWDEAAAATQVGEELCRLKGGSNTLKVAEIWTANRGDSLNYRTTMALDAFERSCPDTEVIHVWSLYNDQQHAYRTTLLFNPIPDVILTTQDEIARDVLSVAKMYLPTHNYNKISTTGWNNSPDLADLVQQRKILTTVDQGVHYPNQGLWANIKTLVDVVQESGLNSTHAVQEELNLGLSTTIQSEAIMVTSDSEGYWIDSILEGYNPESPPSSFTPAVSTGVRGATIAQMDPFEGKFEVIFVLLVSWVDQRLERDPFVSRGILTVDRSSIWTPTGMYFPNEIGFDSSTILHESPASVEANGTVTIETSIHAMFLCETIQELSRYPFESYNCSMSLKGHIGTTLDNSLGFEVDQSDPHFETTPHHGYQSGSEIVNFKLTFVRRPFSIYVGVILPGIVINLIGFMAFWIPGLEQALALGIAALLCALTYRAALELPDIATTTWVEIFLIVNTCYLFAVMIIIWFSFGSSAIMGRYINKCCMPIHPKNVAKEAKAIADSTLQAENTRLSSTANATITEYSTGAQSVSLTQPGVAVKSMASLHVSAHSSCANNSDLESFASGNSCHDVNMNLAPSDCYDELNHTAGASNKEKERAVTKLQRFVSERILDTNHNLRPGNEADRANLNWIGRWFIVPSYFIVVLSLLFGGWGYK